MGIGNLASASSSSSVTISLPLMGIGNCPYLSRGQDIYSAHYPSWGLETFAQDIAEFRGRLFASLPLMGIGNRAYVAGVRRSTASSLITPHGDWKRADRIRPRLRECGAHYPSWGLETLACCRRDRTLQ